MNNFGTAYQRTAKELRKLTTKRGDSVNDTTANNYGSAYKRTAKELRDTLRKEVIPSMTLLRITTVLPTKETSRAAVGLQVQQRL